MHPTMLKAWLADGLNLVSGNGMDRSIIFLTQSELVREILILFNVHRCQHLSEINKTIQKRCCFMSMNKSCKDVVL